MPGRIIIGIDPGKSGGIAFIERSGIRAEKMPDDAGIVEILQVAQANGEVMACMELVGGFAGQAQPGSAMFKFGDGYGFIRGACQALGIPLELVRPQQWQKGLGGLQGVKGVERKRALKAHAARLFPTAKVTLSTCDALLIARWASLNLTSPMPHEPTK